ncbi:ribonuclease e inhibitor rraa dimethylmenaquinone methyltransferase [Colletotrichum plurivorum]|uniref:Ribonuclease e inhibitor rraa dimethylmenaquinone methyltransferase n=1 Tax=Colletotrichum plurivorum TaxID=2175906 RepID=A0A8H6MX83_9PEZI|nr:ribonuclease e inhibitor rraa dimethylmenaquinone methyltransferase [Colletotrichum plurivorum]
MSTSEHDGIIAALENYTTCDVSDALCRLGHPDGGYLPGISMWSPERQGGSTKIIGPVHTVKYALHDDLSPACPTHYIDEVPKNSVIFVSSPADNPNAVFGGLMAMRAKVRGAVGCVIDGRFRDLHEQRKASFPIFARDVGTAPPYGFVKVVGVGVPITVTQDGRSKTISPSDFIVADLNGVVVLPGNLTSEVLDIIRSMQAADTQVAAALIEGMPFAEASKKYRA